MPTYSSTARSGCRVSVEFLEAARCPASRTTYPASPRASTPIAYTSSAIYDPLNRIVTDAA
jgi:hypothetical protein